MDAVSWVDDLSLVDDLRFDAQLPCRIRRRPSRSRWKPSCNLGSPTRYAPHAHTSAFTFVETRVSPEAGIRGAASSRDD